MTTMLQLLAGGGVDPFPPQQIVRPNSDIKIGGWRSKFGGTFQLFFSIADVVPDDDTGYIISLLPDGPTGEPVQRSNFGLETADDPAPGVGGRCVLRMRSFANPTFGDVTCWISRGSTEDNLQNVVINQQLTETWADYTEELDAGEIDTLRPFWDDLSLIFWAREFDPANAFDALCTQAYLEIDGSS